MGYPLKNRTGDLGTFIRVGRWPSLHSFGRRPGSLHTYDIASGELLQSLRGVGLVTAKPIISADGQAILLVHGQSITRYDIAENQISWRVQLAWPHPLYYVALSPDGTRLAICGTAAPIHIRDFSTGVLLQTLSKAKCFGGLAFSSGSHQIYSADLDGSIRVWSVSDGRQIKQINQIKQI